MSFTNVVAKLFCTFIERLTYCICLWVVVVVRCFLMFTQSFFVFLVNMVNETLNTNCQILLFCKHLKLKNDFSCHQSSIKVGKMLCSKGLRHPIKEINRKM